MAILYNNMTICIQYLPISQMMYAASLFCAYMTKMQLDATINDGVRCLTQATEYND